LGVRQPGPACSICSHPRRAEIDADRRPQAKVAKSFGVSASGVYRHRKHATAPARPRSAPEQAPSAPAPPPATLPEAAEVPQETDALKVVVALLETTRRQIEIAERDVEAPYAARAALIKSATGLCSLLARLSGQLAVTQSAIVRSAAWGRILRAFETVFGRHPEATKALAEFAQELAELGE
jgi:hypothetical protein